MGNFSYRVESLLTRKRTFSDGGKIVEKEFRPVLQNVTEEEVLFIYEVISRRYGETFSIDLIKHIPEEKFIYFRGTFLIADPEYHGKGTIYLNSDDYEILFDNLERMLKDAAEQKMRKLIV